MNNSVMHGGNNVKRDQINAAMVITSIHRPTLAIQKFLGCKDWQLIVVADKKTPDDWYFPGVELISVAEQEKMDYPLVSYLPWNRYSRKMLGYLHAIHSGVNLLYDTDDDNIPLQNFNFPGMEGDFVSVAGCLGFVNIYSHFTKKKIWPRGFPLNLIRKSQPISYAGSRNVKVGIWQGLINGDTDVDAVYRLTDNSPCFFENREPIVLSPGTICPFNSQNTLFGKDVFQLLYIPSTITFRFCDILRGLVAQPILWAAGLHVGFTRPTVVQERNPHDYMADFISEIPMYLQTEKVVNLAERVVSSSRTISENLVAVYEILFENQIVKPEELEILKAWLASFKTPGTP